MAPTRQGSWLTKERPHGSYLRQFSVGEGIDTEKIPLTYDNGVLRLSFSRSARGRSRARSRSPRASRRNSAPSLRVDPRGSDRDRPDAGPAGRRARLGRSRGGGGGPDRRPVRRDRPRRYESRARAAASPPIHPVCLVPPASRERAAERLAVSRRYSPFDPFAARALPYAPPGIRICSSLEESMTVTDRVRSTAHDLTGRARGLLSGFRHDRRPAVGIVDRIRRARRPE